MVRKISEELIKCMEDIRKYVESRKSPREQINLKKRKVGILGGCVKKHPLPLKHAIRMIDKRKEKAIAKREMLASIGVSKKRSK
ncbi:hypothetical protein HK407_05g08840 [Ordospora pajunii]|jgi:hypothetical protein|uniref:uncharacterized protein n=1 Tax=Ordospora pajunii TaxID=3039483 RepID=UPI00295272A0|nr:uncharacterized protein HK407_05g08840 [Ordospora pajunii]KAH9411508.1 hypothetical protein HK407_05g08840 [Ordospora pajunii]